MNPSFALLPNEIIVSYLARIPRSYYPTLSTVCKTFHSLVSSTELYEERTRLGNTEQCLYICFTDDKHQLSQWFMLWVNPNCTRKLLGPISPCNSPSTSKATLVVGSEIYVIGGPIDGSPSSSVRIFDCRNHTWRDAPSMNVSRSHAIALAYNGKIYVIEGRGTTVVEVFDIKTQTWTQSPVLFTEASECLFRIAEVEGTVYVKSYCHVQSRYSMYAYEAKQGKWELCDNKFITFPVINECLLNNVYYQYNYKHTYGRYVCKWLDINSGKWKEVKGLDSLQDTRSYGLSYPNMSKLVGIGGKLLFIWEGDNIWCAEIAIEKRNGDEVWGNVEWVDVVHSGSWRLLNCLSVSV